MPNSMRRAMLTAVAVLLLSTAPSTVGLAAPQTAPEDEIGYDSDFWSLKEGARFAKYYRTHALISPRPEPEQRLANGVRWRLLVDERTGMRIPRITWMPNQQSMAVANEFFEMAHGAAIAKAEDFNRIWLHDRTMRAVQGLAPYSPLPLQSDVEVTYATSRFVNYIELGTRETSEKTFTRIARSRIFDIRKGGVYEFSFCPIRHEQDFYGHWTARPIDHPTPFALCSEAEDDAFTEIVKRWALLAIPASEHNSQPVDGCSRAAHDLARWARPGVTYLTPAGLAFLLTDAWPIGRPANCRFAVGDPVIVPYRALKRFMRPGPLSDELQKLN
jgi:hypothetical protein